MASRHSTDPNRFGPHSAGVIRFADQAKTLAGREWASVAEMARDVESSEIFRENLENLKGRSPALASAVRRLLEEVYQADHESIRDSAGRLGARRVRAALEYAGFAVAFPEMFSVDGFELFTSPFVGVGIDCKELSEMGEVQDA